jgi:hypothetical protein
MTFVNDYGMAQTYRSADEVNEAMSRVYGHTGMAVLTSMIISWFVGHSPELIQFLFTGVMKWVVMFAPLAAIFIIGAVLSSNPSKGLALICLHGFAAIMGLSFATIFIVFKLGSIANAFFGAVILFGTLSGYGYFTKRNLDSIGKFMIIGLIAICIASIVNIFIGSSAMSMAISALAIVIFLGLTAYDSQQIRESLMVDTGSATEISGALTLYMDFINLFLNLLNLFGDKKD